LLTAVGAHQPELAAPATPVRAEDQFAAARRPGLVVTDSLAVSQRYTKPMRPRVRFKRWLRVRCGRRMWGEDNNGWGKGTDIARLRRRLAVQPMSPIAGG